MTRSIEDARRAQATVLAALGIAWLAACADSPTEPSGDDDPEASVSRQELDENRRRFEQSVGSTYAYDYQNVCFCGPDTRENVRITVRDGARVSVTSVDDGAPIPTARWPGFLTVDEIFDDIARALDTGAAAVRVTFDPTLGYPRDVYIDVDERIADEERGYAVRELTATP